MRLLILDVETTGLDPKADKVIELAACHYDTDHGIVWLKSELYEHNENPSRHVNGIDPGMTRGMRSWPGTGTRLPQWSLAQPVDVYVSHGTFDRAWFSADHRPWIDTVDGFDWPRFSSSRSLAAVALAHGVGVVRAHRAFDDVLTLASCFDRIDDLETRIRRALRPRILVRAIVARGNRTPKDFGFRWDEDRWVREMAADDYLITQFPFDTYEVQS